MSEEAEPQKYDVKPGRADPYATWLKRELKHDCALLASRYDVSGRYLFTGAFDNFVHRWDLSDESEEGKREPLTGHESWVRAMAWFPNSDQQLLATGDYVGRLIVWDTTGDTAPKPLHSFIAHAGSIRAVSVSADGKLIASAGNDNMVRVWSAEDGKKVHEFAGHDCHVYNTAFNPNGDGLASADLKGAVKHWDLKSGKLARDLDASVLHTYSEKYTVDVGGVRGMTFSPDGSQLACTGSTGDDKGIAIIGSPRIVIVDWESGEAARELKPATVYPSMAWSARFHPEGFIVGSGGCRVGGYLWFWQPGQDEAFHEVKFKQRAPGFDVDIAPDGKTLAVANHDGAIRFWEMAPEPPKEEVKAG